MKMMSSAITNWTVPVIHGKCQGPIETPCSTRESVSERKVTIAAPATAPVTDARPPITSIASVENVRAK